MLRAPSGEQRDPCHSCIQVVMEELLRREGLLVVVSGFLTCVFIGCSGNSSSTPSAPPATARNPLPSVVSIDPSSILAGSAAQTVTLTGGGFIGKSVVAIGGTAVTTTYVNAKLLTAVLPASAIAADGTVSVTVTNPAPGGGTSLAEPWTLAIPTPVMASLSPQAVPQGAPATITVTGTGFEANSVAQWNGSTRPTTFVNGTTLTVALTAQDASNFGLGQITVTNPGGLITTPLDLAILANMPTILSVSPSTVTAYTGSTVPQQVLISGSGFASNATVQVNGTSVPIASQNSGNIAVTVAANYFASAGSVSLVVSNPGSPVVQSNVGVISVTGASSPAFTLAPDSAPAGSPDTVITLSGTGFYPDSIVNWNSTPLVTTYANPSSVTAVVPAGLLATFANASISVTTPENTGQNPAPQPFTTYLALTVNDIAYNPVDGLIYASIPGSVGQGLGNSVLGIDPSSGVIERNIFVGSEPNRIAISTDGTELFVALDGASAIRPVSLLSYAAGTQFNITAATTVAGLAAVPGQTNSIAVLDSSGIVTLYDSGVARAQTSSGPEGSFGDSGASMPISYGSSASTLYVLEDALYQLSVGTGGVTAATPLSTPLSAYSSLQYDDGRIYTSGGTVLDAISGTQVGQFSADGSQSSSPAAVSGPIVSDSVLGKAFILPTGLFSAGEILAFDEKSFDPTGSVAFGGLENQSSTPADLVRWGQDGLAFHVGSQLYVLHSSIVKDTSTEAADLKATIQAPATATTGSTMTYQFKVANLGEAAAQGAVLNITLPAAVIPGAISGNQGSCSGTSILYCDLGSIAAGGSVTISVAAVPTVSGVIAATAVVSSTSYDPAAANNQATASTSITGSLYSQSPNITQISPSLLPAGSGSFTLDVDGIGFSTASTVLWNGTALPTSFISSGQLTASVDASQVRNYGYGLVSVSTAAPGGGSSTALPLSVYTLLDVPANAISFDPFTRKIYAALPSTSTTLMGNSIVTIDPISASIGTPVQVGSEPNVLSETSDGQYLYVGISGAESLARFNLPAQSVDATIPIEFQDSGQANVTSQMTAVSVATIPGSDTSVAIETAQNGIGVFDMAGSSGTFRQNFSQPGSGDSPVFSDATHFYASSNGSFFRYTVDAQGVTAVDATAFNGLNGSSNSIGLNGGVVYGAGGGIINPLKPAEYGMLPFGSDAYGYPLIGNGIIPDTQQSRAFATPLDASGSYTFLQRFDTRHFTAEQQLQLPVSPVAPVTGVRCGQDGLALLLPGSAIDGSSQVMLIRGPFILPAEASVQAVPALTHTDRATIAAGSGNLYLTVIGSAFLPGAVVLWNGSPRSTTYVDAAHLSAAIAAADVRTAATIQLASRNPGSPVSNALQISVR
jgi:uncharacterized repeat protein (TIGR01451 family)